MKIIKQHFPSILILCIAFGMVFFGFSFSRRNIKILQRVEEAHASIIASSTADVACGITFADFNFNNHNGVLYNLDQPDHPVAVSNNLDASNSFCATINYVDSNDHSIRVIGEFSPCVPQCFGNNGASLGSLPPGRYSFVEYGNNFDACMGGIPGPGVSYQSCKSSSDFISESLFEITSPPAS